MNANKEMGELNSNIQKRQAIYLILVIFSISIGIRLPNLNRPVSKHHEFITAVILMNASSWRQAGGGDLFHYTPLMSYQNPGDKHPESAVNIDDKGNQLYLSLGPGWYIIPYFFYQFLHLPIQPLYLQILNLSFNGLTLILFFYFLELLIPPHTTNRYFRILTGCTLLLFSPGMLWYFGNGYVHTAIMLPFILLVLIALVPMLQNPQKITPLRSLLLSCSIILSVYLDWFVVFLCLFAIIWSLFRLAKDKRYAILAIVTGTALFTGIALIFWQFASYAGVHTVATYWQLRFGSRSIANKNDSLTAMLVSLAGHMITCYLPLIILLAAGILYHITKKIRVGFSRQEILFIGLYSCTVCLYPLVLIDWASAHEFSLVPFSLLLALLGARFLYIPRTITARYLLIAAFFGMTIGQYYFINRPGSRSRDGMAYDTFAVFGEHLKQVPPDYKIFANLPELCPMIEYYAGRNITLVPDQGSAEKLMRKWNITKAVWVTNDKFQFEKMEWISLP